MVFITGVLPQLEQLDKHCCHLSPSVWCDGPEILHLHY